MWLLPIAMWRQQKKVVDETRGDQLGKRLPLRSLWILGNATQSAKQFREFIGVLWRIRHTHITAAVFPSSPGGHISDQQWSTTLGLNVTANYLLADEAARILRDQDLQAAIVLTSSANAVVPKRGSEAYDVSKAALSHLVRELAVSLSPNVR
jgi:NAD(P)-dependent dehydrogenase (short-subunit alcohol dehydrogenase family)